MLRADCSADAASARRWIGCCEACGRVRAGCWSCAARRGSARPRCWSTSSSRRRAAASRGPPACSPRWSSRSPACTSCARPMLDGLERLPGPQRDALRRRVRAAERRQRPDHFLVGLAVLEPAGRGGRGRARWSAWSTTRSGSIARPRRRWRSLRAGCSRSAIALVFAVREPSDADDARRPAGAGRRRARRRRRARAARLRRSAGRLDERVRDRIVAETRGNPLALLELPRGLTPAELAGGFGLPDRGPLSRTGSSGASCGASSRSRPTRGSCCSRRRPSRSATSPLLWRAAERLGIGADAAGPAEAAGADRARRPGALPPSAGALGGVPGGTRARTPGGAPRAGRGDGSRGGSGSPRMASRARGGRSRRGGRRRARALGRPRPGAAAASRPRPRSWSERPS